MTTRKPIFKHRLALFALIIAATFMLSGCQNGSLGAKDGSVYGKVTYGTKDYPLANVLIRVQNRGGNDAIIAYGTTKEDGTFYIPNLQPSTWEVFVDAKGYNFADNGEPANMARVEEVVLESGCSVAVKPIRLVKTSSLLTGTLRAYIVDAATSAPINGFTVSQITPADQQKNKYFESAEDFRTVGWTGLEGGKHHYRIDAPRYVPFYTSAALSEENAHLVVPDTGADGGLEISNVPLYFGTVYLKPMKAQLSGLIKNLPGHVVKGVADGSASAEIWAEAGGQRIVGRVALGGDIVSGVLSYTVPDIPVTARNIKLTVSLKGYPPVVIADSITIPRTADGGTHKIEDFDFSTVTPITGYLVVEVASTKPEDDDPGTFPPGHVAEVIINGNWKDVGTYKVVSGNYYGTVTIPDIMTEYPVSVLVTNKNKGYVSGREDDVIIDQSGHTLTKRVRIMLSEN